jgi:hypothetical protein
MIFNHCNSIIKKVRNIKLNIENIKFKDIFNIIIITKWTLLKENIRKKPN